MNMADQIFVVQYDKLVALPERRDGEGQQLE